VAVETETPFTLLVKTEYLEEECKIEVPVGSHEFLI